MPPVLAAGLAPFLRLSFSLALALSLPLPRSGYPTLPCSIDPSSSVVAFPPRAQPAEGKRKNQGGALAERSNSVHTESSAWLEAIGAAGQRSSRTIHENCQICPDTSVSSARRASRASSSSSKAALGRAPSSAADDARRVSEEESRA